MAWNKLSNYKTTISEKDGDTAVTYHTTDIVRWNDSRVILESGGHRSVTTKRKMNQASNQFDLGYGVYQKDFAWYVDLPNGETVDYEDGMEISR
jgi:hypothetical protein